MATNTIRIGKVEAAKRQLRTAISLWFNDGDPVAVHALAFAAYEVMHSVSEKRDPYRRDLLFDTLWIKDEYRGKWNKHIRKEANFFKHADRDGDSVIEFNPKLSECFIMFAIAARELCGEQSSDEESIFCHWLTIHRPDLITDDWKKRISESIPIDDIQELRARPKKEFFEIFHHARLLAAQRRHRSVPRFPLQ